MSISTNDFGSSIAGILPQSSTPPIVVGALLYYAELNAVVPAFYSNSPIMNANCTNNIMAPKLLVPVGIGGNNLDVTNNSPSQTVTINVDSKKDVTFTIEGETESKQCLLWKLDLQSTDNNKLMQISKSEKQHIDEVSEAPQEINENVRVTRSAAKRIKLGGNLPNADQQRKPASRSQSQSQPNLEESSGASSPDGSGGKRTQCPLCDKTCSKGYMKNHMRLVHRSPSMQCDTCQKVFKNKYTLAKHVKRHDDGQDAAAEKPFPCEVCGRRYQFQCQLKHHLRLHAGERPFKCEICQKDFPHKGSLKAHKSSMHAGHKFQCELCGKCFTTSVYLKLHRQRVHEGTRPLLKCDICGEEFKHKGTFRKHKLKHAGIRPYRCDVCGKRFLTSTVLKSHSYIHTGELPFPCDTCGRKFRQKVSLRNHQFTHLGYKPYQCVLCTRQFLCPALLKQHKCSAKRMRSADGADAVVPVPPVIDDARATCLEVV